MTDQKNKLATLFADSWKDETLRARLLDDPSTVLTEYGLDVPEGVQVQVVANTENTVHITLPSEPVDESILSDEEIQEAAGGTTRGITCGTWTACWWKC